MQPSEVTELLRPLRTAYYSNVRDIALEIMDEYALSSDPSYLDDAIAQRIDGTSWTVFTHSAGAALMVSDNDDAALEALGEDDAKACTVEQRAAFAMQADVTDLIQAWRNYPNALASERERRAAAKGGA